ncbi:MAG: hypothetical protein IPP47_31440 [Bryobacterales bacterium]|nr:hypothetical protein [Bryobacterales bacterium]
MTVSIFLATLGSTPLSAAKPLWTNIIPLPRENPGLAYDAARGQMVLFGGFGGVALNDTWVWSGTAWVAKSPANSPSKRSDPAMVYDAARGQVVLFGGYDNSFKNDTWVWDGTNWSQKQPVTSPPALAPDAMSSYAMVYDAARGEVVLFGNSAGVWVWDGTNWSNRNSPSSPSARAAFAMAYDSARGQVVLFGGYSGSQAQNETWVWDGNIWSQKNPANRPPALAYHAMANDAAHGQIVLFGGLLSSGPRSGDTWVWDGSNWARKSTPVAPPVRAFHSMAYEGASGKVLLLGGVDPPNNPADMWLWNGTSWTERVNGGGAPLQRFSHAMAYDSTLGQTVLFGGISGGSTWFYPPVDTWVWGGAGWTLKSPAISPTARVGHAMAYDAKHKQVILFAGGLSTYENDTWAWDGAAWTQLHPTSNPPPRMSHAMAYDSIRGEIVLFGGADSTGQFLGDTWVWDGVTWTQKSPAHSPSARCYHSMAYDSARGQVVLFGGADFRGDTWVWDGTDWTEKHPNNIPTPRQSHAMAYEGIGGRIVLFGGEPKPPAISFLNDVWVWNGTDWTGQESPLSRPTGRRVAALAGDTGRGVVIMFGGFNNDTFQGDTWVTTGVNLACTYALSAGSAALPPNASTGSLSVTPLNEDCPWTATANSSGWLDVTSGYEGRYPSQIVYSAAANPTPNVRVGTITIGGKTFTVTQDRVGGCTYQLSSPGVSLPATASTGSFTVTTNDPSCPWTAAVTSSGWLQMTSGNSGAGPAQIGFSAPANATISERTGSISVGGQMFTIKQAAVPGFTLSANRTLIAFGTTTNASAVSPAQSVTVTTSSGIGDWTAVSDSPWLRVTPATGKGSGGFSVFVVPYAYTPPGILTGKVSIHAMGATNSPPVVNCTLTVKSTTAVPFGSFDTPANNLTGVSGSIAVTGWALDDIGVKQVSIWRDRVGPEPVYPNGYVYIGDATFVPGARPDVEGKYSTSPNANRAGWGYMMLTNGLPAKGNGTFKLHAIAVDEEGNSFELGSKTITVDNLHSIKPFGAIDNPAPGQVISGTIVNDGWALTPQPALLAADGSTIWVSIDSVNVAHPAYGMLRNDVASLFPGYANSSGSLGQHSLDSTLYANAMHTIAWIAYDNLGHGDGMGSRFFHILNAGGASAGSAPAAPAVADAERAYQLRAARLARPVTAAASYPAVRQGFDLDAPLTPIRQGGEGLLEPIELKELDRMEIHLPGGQKWSAGLRVGDELRELPVGSTFDADGGIFYWQLGPGFLGEYVLEFHAEDGSVLPVPVRVGLE